MSLPEPTMPEPEPPPSEGRADWLCGPDEGLEAELTRTQDGAPLQAPKLIRPGSDAPLPPPPAPRVRLGSGVPGATSFVPSGPPARPPGVAPANVPQAWTGAASSVPRLQDDDAPVARTFGVDTSRVEFPMEEISERASVRSPEPAAEAAEPIRKPVAAPSEFVAPVYRPWWQEALDQLRHNRMWQIAVAGLLLIPVALLLMPRGPQKAPIRELREHAREWDGRTLRVAGKVGEVFETGAGYTFYLIQGRDTIVVFTRSRLPRQHQKVTVTGTLSTGFLDGQARLALFEEAQ